MTDDYELLRRRVATSLSMSDCLFCVHLFALCHFLQPKAAAANKKARDRKKKRKLEGKNGEGAPSTAADNVIPGRTAPTSHKRKMHHNE